MTLDDFLEPRRDVIELKAADRWGAIDELIAHLASTNRIKQEHVEGITAAVKKRETSMSTGIGFGIGIPHAATDLVSETVGVIGRSQNGIEFDALDGQPVKLVLLFLVPAGYFPEHVHALADVVKELRKLQ